MLRLPPISSLSHSFPTRRSSILHICWTPRATTARRCAVSRKTGAFMRPSGRSPDQMRVIEMIPGFTRHAEGSCLIKFGDTHVLCNASVERSEEHTSELQSLMRISYAVFCLKKKNNNET